MFRKYSNPFLAVTGLIIYFLLCPSALAGLPKNNPIPGGVAVVTLPAIAGGRPVVRFGDKKVYAELENARWTAVIGLPQDILPGKYILTMDTELGSFSKKSFRIEPVPPSQTQRTVNLPEKLYALQFDAMISNSHKSIRNSDQDFDDPLEPNFVFHQIVGAGSYLPYGWLVKQQKLVRIINHPWITYITQADEIVRSPATAIVEQIYLSDSSGLSVILNHGKGMKSIISHLNDTILKPGEPVKTGEIVGAAKTIEDLAIGRVDWQLILNGNLIDPLQFSPPP